MINRGSYRRITDIRVEILQVRRSGEQSGPLVVSTESVRYFAEEDAGSHSHTSRP